MKRLVAVIGLGCVGLPVATTFAGKGARVVAFDIDARRVAELTKGHDRTREVTAAELGADGQNITTRTADLCQADFYIVTVPTPIDASKHPTPNRCARLR